MIVSIQDILKNTQEQQAQLVKMIQEAQMNLAVSESAPTKNDVIKLLGDLQTQAQKIRLHVNTEEHPAN